MLLAECSRYLWCMKWCLCAALMCAQVFVYVFLPLRKRERKWIDLISQHQEVLDSWNTIELKYSAVKTVKHSFRKPKKQFLETERRTIIYLSR